MTAGLHPGNRRGGGLQRSPDTLAGRKRRKGGESGGIITPYHQFLDQPLLLLDESGHLTTTTSRSVKILSPVHISNTSVQQASCCRRVRPAPFDNRQMLHSTRCGCGLAFRLRNVSISLHTLPINVLIPLQTFSFSRLSQTIIIN